MTNFTGRLLLPGDSRFLGHSRLVRKRSFLLVFDINPFSGEYFLRLARKHGDKLFLQSLRVLRLARTVPVK